MPFEIATQSRSSIRCGACDYELSDGYSTHCPHDGTPLSVTIRSFQADRPTLQPFARRFHDALPIRDEKSCREVEPLKTELIRNSQFAKKVGIPGLVLKNECSLPTGTTKARMAAGALSFLLERGVHQFVTTSTGNSTTALARLMREYPELEMFAFAGKEFVGRHELDNLPNVHFRAVTGDFVAAGRKAKQFCDERGYVWEGGFFNPARRVALATAYIEACDELGDAPGWYFQAVSSAMGLVGVGEVARCQLECSQITGMPRLVGVQQASCSPLVRAYHENVNQIQPRHRIRNPKGIAKAILRGDPTASYPTVKSHLDATNGNMVAVTESEIITTQRLVLDELQLQIGEAAAAALAGAIDQAHAGVIASHETVLVNLTGRT